MSALQQYFTSSKATYFPSETTVQTDSVFTGMVDSNTEKMFPIDSMIYGIVLSLVVLFILAVNGRVILAFILDKKLRYSSNLFVLNLSVADFLFGLMSIPFMTMNQVMGRWVFGKAVCSMWQLATLWLRCESSFTLALISFDRYLMVKRAVQYQRNARRRETFAMIAGSWVLSFVLTGPAILVWDVILANGVVSEDRCAAHYVFDAPVYNVFLHILMFVGPSVTMTFCYVQVVRDLKKRAKRRAMSKSQKLGAGRFDEKQVANRSPDGNDDNNTEKTKTLSSPPRPCHPAKMNIFLTIDETKDKCHAAYPTFTSVKTVVCPQASLEYLAQPQRERKTTMDSAKSFASSWFRKRSLTNEVKVSRTVGLLIFMYIITCAPFNIATVVIGIYHSAITSSAYTLLFVVMAINGAANPMIYAFRSPPIREHLLSVPCRRRSWSNGVLAIQ